MGKQANIGCRLVGTLAYPREEIQHLAVDLPRVSLATYLVGLFKAHLLRDPLIQCLDPGMIPLKKFQKTCLFARS